eukprot:1159299-Pelagomonas_calceolata.AAC.1
MPPLYPLNPGHLPRGSTVDATCWNRSLWAIHFGAHAWDIATTLQTLLIAQPLHVAWRHLRQRHANTHGPCTASIGLFWASWALCTEPLIASPEDMLDAPSSTPITASPTLSMDYRVHSLQSTTLLMEWAVPSHMHKTSNQLLKVCITWHS